MSQDDQQDAFLNDLQSLVQRYCNEFDLTLVSALGAIELVKLDIFQQMTGAYRKDDSEDGDSEDED